MSLFKGVSATIIIVIPDVASCCTIWDAKANTSDNVSSMPVRDIASRSFSCSSLMEEAKSSQYRFYSSLLLSDMKKAFLFECRYKAGRRENGVKVWQLVDTCLPVS